MVWLYHSLFGVLTSIAFFCLDIRNAELVNCGRDALDKLEGNLGLTIRKEDKERKHFLVCWPILRSKLKHIVKHGFWFQLIELITGICIFVCDDLCITWIQVVKAYNLPQQLFWP